ncbi:hypothetical protein [Neorhodopirellula lusitana]
MRLHPHPSSNSSPSSRPLEVGNHQANPTQGRCDSRPAAALAVIDAEKSRGKRRLVLWTLMAVFVAWWIAGSIASAQKYPTYELDEAYERFKDPREGAKLERAAGQLVTTRDLAKLDGSVQGMAKFYLEKYIPWKLTQPETLPEMPEIIDGLLKNLERVQRSDGAGTRALLAGTFIGMRTIAEGKYIPAARINAISALSRINARPLDITNARPPLPLSYSFPILMKLYKDKAEVDGVRAAALIGLHRYASLAFPVMTPAQKKELVDAMNELLASEAPAGREPESHAYLQRYAVDLLDLLRNPRDASLGTQLISISTTEDASDVIALYSASQLGNFRQGLQEQAKDPAPIVQKWSLRAFQAIEDEIARIEGLTRPMPAAQQPPNPRDFLQKSREARRNEARAENEMAAGSMRRGMGMGMEMDQEMGMGMDMGMEMGMGMGMDMGMDMMDMDMMGMGMMGGMVPVAKPQPPEVDISRRYLTDVLQQLLRGATGSRKGELPDQPGGLIAAVAQPNRDALQGWIDEMKTVMTTVNDEMLDDRVKWLEMLQNQRLVLGDLAGLDVEKPEPEDTEDPGGRHVLPGFGMPAAAEPMPGLPGAAPEALPGLPGT